MISGRMNCLLGYTGWEHHIGYCTYRRKILILAVGEFEGKGMFDSKSSSIYEKAYCLESIFKMQ